MENTGIAAAGEAGIGGKAGIVGTDRDGGAGGGINLMNEEWASSNAAEILAVVMYLVMIAYLTFNSLNAKKE